MLTFKNKKSGLIVEVTEEFANQVLIPQDKYIQIKEEPIKEVKAPKKSKKKQTKKVK